LGLREVTENGVDGVHGDLVLSRITDETLGISEADVRRRRSVPLVVGDDFNSVMLPHTDTRVGGSEIDSDSRTLSFSGHCFGVRRRQKKKEKYKRRKTMKTTAIRHHCDSSERSEGQ